MHQAPLLAIKQIKKQFGSLTAVNGISFDIQPGICFGLLGPNGAGKTTTIEMIEGIQRPTSGEIYYQGQPKQRVQSRFKQETGIQFQNTALQDFLTVRETLELFKSFYQHTLPVDEVIQLCALNDFLSKDTRKISGGQKQRLLLALALINDPKLLILDEPTVGLDPQARRNFWELILSIKQKNKTIILTTHYMEEATLLCDEIVIIDQGKIIAQGRPKQLVLEMQQAHTIHLPQHVLTHKPIQHIHYTQTNGHLQIMTDDLDMTLSELIKQGISLKELSIQTATLEDLFLNLTGHQLRE